MCQDSAPFRPFPPSLSFLFVGLWHIIKSICILGELRPRTWDDGETTNLDWWSTKLTPVDGFVVKFTIQFIQGLTSNEPILLNGFT